MKALILVGGFGTRLRPLTLTVPKPLVEFANKPMLTHQIEALKDAGVTEVIVAINYQPEVMEKFISELQKELGIRVVISQEKEPLGTAGPLALARHLLVDSEKPESFFVLNSDVICEYPLKELYDYHVKKQVEGTILVTKVQDPSKYGVVVINDDGVIDRFVEKPKNFVGDKINAGIYVLHPKVLDRIELKPTSIEREIFPLIANDKRLAAFVLEGYWMDIGQPKDFLKGLSYFLEKKSQNVELKGSEVLGNVLIDKGAKIGINCKIGPNVSISKGCEVAEGVRLRNSALMTGVTVKSNAYVSDSIVGWHSNIGKWCRVQECVVGEDVRLLDENFLNESIVLPHKEIKESVLEKQIIM